MKNMKKKIFTLIVGMLFVMPSFAQLEINEDSFKEVPGFVNINTDKMFDDNEKPYAVLKIRTENINAKQRRELEFKGDARTFFEVEYKDGEVWLYISYYASFLKVSHPDLSSTEFWFPYDMKPKCGYELTLTNKTVDGKEIMDRFDKLEEYLKNNESAKQTTITVSQSNNDKIDLFETAGLMKKRGNNYYLGNRKLTKRDYKDLIEDCPEAWAKYKKGKTWKTVGWVSICLAIPIFAAGDDDILPALGLVLGLSSIPEFIIGNNKKREAYKEFNKYCAKPATLSMGLTSNGGIGIALTF